MGYRRWLQLLIIALAVDLLATALFQAEEVFDLIQGDQETSTLRAAAWLVWPALAVVAAVGTARASLRTRAELHRTRQALAADASASGDWVWETDTEHRLTYSSPGVEALLGYTAAELLGTRIFDLLADDGEREKALEATRNAPSSQSGWTTTQYIWMHRDGHRVPTEGRSTVLLDERGRLVGFRGTRRAVTTAEEVSARASAARAAIEELLRNESFNTALQPIVSLTTGRVCGFEVLSRFHDGRGPDSWFRDADVCGLTGELEQRTLTAATQLLAELPESTYLSINAGPTLITDPEFTHELVTSQLPLDRLVIEITEHARVTDYDQLCEATKSLRQRGVRIAIDDTGAGYASLRHIIELRPDNIKLDRMLIAGLEEDAARRSLITALVLLALEVDATITGEGVETHAQLGALNLLGVDNAQGYLLAKPSTHRSQWIDWFTRQWPVDKALTDHLTSNTTDPKPR